MNRTLKNILYVFVADVVVKLVSTSTTFLVARMLNPAEYGVWITLILIVSYAPIASLGSVETLLKEFPFLAGRGDFEAAARVERGVFGSVIVAALFVAALGISAFSWWPGLVPGAQAGLAALMLGTACVSFLSAFFYFRFSAHQNFRLVSSIDSGRAVATFVCLIGGTILWGLPGTVLGYLAAEAMICAISAWLSIQHSWRPRPLFSPRLLAAIVRTGLPITIIWWVFILQSSADRIISMSMLGEAATGMYGLGVSIVSLVILLPVTISRVLYPRLNERIGQSSNPSEVWNLVVAPSQVLGLLLPALIGVLIVAAPFVYQRLLPKYGPGLASAQILLAGSFFTCIVRPGANFLIATSRQHVVLGYIALSLLLNVSVNVAMARLGYGITGIAVGSSISSLVLASLVWMTVLRDFEPRTRARLVELARLYLPHLVMMTMLGATAVLAPALLSRAGYHEVWLSMSLVLTFCLIVYSVPGVRHRILEIRGLLQLQLGGQPRRVM